MMHALRHVRQMFANSNAGYRRGNRLELAPNLGRRIGLRIVRIDMARTAIVKDENTGPDRWTSERSGCGDRHGLPTPQARKPDAQKAGEPALQGISAGDRLATHA